MIDLDPLELTGENSVASRLEEALWYEEDTYDSWNGDWTGKDRICASCEQSYTIIYEKKGIPPDPKPQHDSDCIFWIVQQLQDAYWFELEKQKVIETE